ncbi:glycerol-3-phosphate acyltransferase, partial [Candidatus Izimaplasma bacterium]|nr:glycerol-3-phosphate acyltransferase [Candidatus Izimaplasma bacterium]
MEYIIIILMGYLIGTLNPALVTAKVVSGIDIREVNSKNPGTSNIAITLGLKYAVLVGIIDILKGVIPVVVLRILYPDSDYMWFIGGISVTLGHIYPFYMKFKGGKGTATFGGVVIAAAPLLSLAVVIVFIIVTFWSDFIAVSTIVGFTLIPIGIYFLG